MSLIDDFMTEIKTRLETISGVTVIYPTRQGQDQLTDKTIVLKAGSVERLPEYDRMGNPPGVGQILPVIVTCVTIPSELALTPNAFAKEASANASAAQNAITAPATWYQMGGDAIDCEVGPVQFIEPSDESFGAAQFTVSVKYRVQETNFETVRA